MRVRLPRALDGGMRHVRTLHPVSLSIARNLTPPHEATMTLPDDERLTFRDWVELFDKNGSVGIFRVTGVGERYGEGNTYALSHGFAALRDATIKGEAEVSGTAGQLIARLLPYQTATANGVPLWAMGTAAETGTVTYTYTNPNLKDAILEVMQKVPGYALSFDQSGLPWKLNIVKMSDADACEGRFGRNLQSVSVSMDESDLYTRVELDDREGVYDADTKDAYGVINKVLVVPEGATEEAIQRHIAEFLKSHKEPATTIELDGVDMSEATGETLDAFTPGKLCRACLPDYGATIRARIVSVERRDVFGDPDGVHISMANRTQTVSDILTLTGRQTSKLESGATRTSRRVGSTIAKLEDTYTEVKEIGGQLTAFENYVGIQLDAQNAQLRLKASQSELNETKNRLSQAEIVLDGANANIKLKADQTVVDQLGTRVTAAEIDIDGANAAIALKVSKNGVISAINLTPEEIRIQAKRINLDGYVTASQLSTEIALIKSSFSDMISTKILYAQNTFQYQGWTAKWASGNFVTSVTFPRYVEKTIYYTNSAGQSASQLVLTPSVNQRGSYSKSNDYPYLSY